MMLKRMRSRVLVTVALAGVLIAGAPAAMHAQSDAATTDEASPVDIGLVLPEMLGETPLALERLGPEEMAQRMADSDDVLFAALQAVLEEQGAGPASLSAAMARSSDDRYQVTALRVEGLDARAVLTALFTRLLEEQLRASGSSNDDAVTDFAADLEALLPWQMVEGREIVSPQAATDTTFELVYPAGEVLYLAQGQDGLTMAEVLAVLPESPAAPG